MESGKEISAIRRREEAEKIWSLIGGGEQIAGSSEKSGVKEAGGTQAVSREREVR